MGLPFELRAVRPAPASARIDDRSTVSSPELEPRPSRPIGAISVAERLSRAGNGDARHHGRGVREALRLAVCAGEVGDRAKAKIPTLVLLGPLRRIPHALDGRVDP
jgi:hypothetical protein